VVLVHAGAHPPKVDEPDAVRQGFST
jgi:hypothetical protein